MEAYLANVELMAARAGKQHMLKDVDIVSKILIIVDYFAKCLGSKTGVFLLKNRDVLVKKLVCSGLITGVYCYKTLGVNINIDV